jgi:hypothetical protein
MTGEIFQHFLKTEGYEETGIVATEKWDCFEKADSKSGSFS